MDDTRLLEYDHEDISFRLGDLYFNLIYAHFMPSNPNWTEFNHCHSSYEFHFIPQGKGKLYIADHIYPITQGCVYVTGPEVYHRQKTDLSDPMTEFCFNLEIRKISLSSRDLNQMEPDEWSISKSVYENRFWFGYDKNNIIGLSEQVFLELGKKETGYRLSLKALLQQIIIAIARSYMECTEKQTDWNDADRRGVGKTDVNWKITDQKLADSKIRKSANRTDTNRKISGQKLSDSKIRNNTNQTDINRKISDTKLVDSKKAANGTVYKCVNNMDSGGKHISSEKILDSTRRKILDDYLYIRYKEKITLELLASRLGIGKRQLSRIIFSYYSMTLKEKLTSVRLENAKEMLAETDFTMETISEKTGFLSPSYFSRVFREHEKMSPGRYRQLHKMKSDFYDS